jgi:molybdopterin-biosynthesis enzyme MoeA-like protein
MSSQPALIGPIHGDITAYCVAMAFGMQIDTDPRALAILYEWVKRTGAEMNEAHLRMTRISKGAEVGVASPLDRQCNREGGRAIDHAGDAR